MGFYGQWGCWGRPAWWVPSNAAYNARTAVGGFAALMGVIAQAAAYRQPAAQQAAAYPPGDMPAYPPNYQKQAYPDQGQGAQGGSQQATIEKLDERINQLTQQFAAMQRGCSQSPQTPVPGSSAPLPSGGGQAGTRAGQHRSGGTAPSRSSQPAPDVDNGPWHDPSQAQQHPANQHQVQPVLNLVNPL